MVHLSDKKKRSCIKILQTVEILKNPFCTKCVLFSKCLQFSVFFLFALNILFSNLFSDRFRQTFLSQLHLWMYNSSVERSVTWLSVAVFSLITLRFYLSQVIYSSVDALFCKTGSKGVQKMLLWNGEVLALYATALTIYKYYLD